MKPASAEAAVVNQSSWQELSEDARFLLQGKLKGLWGATSDAAAFDALSLDKQQALFLLMHRLLVKNLWQTVKKIENVYGVGGVGIDFIAWPFLESALSRSNDFTRRFARRRSVTGGFYEKGSPVQVLHFLYKEGHPRIWHVHFDLYSPVYSLTSALRHVRYEYIGKMTPDWRMIKQSIRLSHV